MAPAAVVRTALLWPPRPRLEAWGCPSAPLRKGPDVSDPFQQPTRPTDPPACLLPTNPFAGTVDTLDLNGVKAARGAGRSGPDAADVATWRVTVASLLGVVLLSGWAALTTDFGGPDDTEFERAELAAAAQQQQQRQQRQQRGDVDVAGRAAAAAAAAAAADGGGIEELPRGMRAPLE